MVVADIGVAAGVIGRIAPSVVIHAARFPTSKLVPTSKLAKSPHHCIGIHSLRSLWFALPLRQRLKAAMLHTMAAGATRAR